jgi:hypothetical protein
VEGQLGAKANGTAACHQGLLLMVGQALPSSYCVKVESVQAILRGSFGAMACAI